eukprot:snap_masked-scaffold_21-processed-gene-1.12-mRNA-1 protein AED:1.00 eAED:1.00 QI:0/0/0/0/1/1/2/0/570
MSSKVTTSAKENILGNRYLSLILPHAPLILEWLSHTSEYPAEFFVQVDKQDNTLVNSALNSLFNLAEKFNFQNLCYKELEKVFCIWVHVLRLLLTQTYPKLIPLEIGLDLIYTISWLNSSTTVKEVYNILIPILDKLPRSHFEILGSLCIFIRDKSESSVRISSLIGPKLLIPNISMYSNFSQETFSKTASAVFHLLVIEAESLFGKIDLYKKRNSFGKLSFTNCKKIDARVNFSLWAENDFFILKNSLRAFLSWREPINVKKFDKWFEVYEQSLDVDWTSLPINSYKVSTNYGFLITLSNDLYSRYGQIPPGWDNFLFQRKYGYLRYLDTGLKEEIYIIHEICILERNNNFILNDFMEKYVNLLKYISVGKNKEAKAGLLLEEYEIDQLFGKPFENIYEFSNKLMAEFNILLLRKGPLMGKERGRTGILIDGVKEVLTESHHLIESFFVSYPTMMFTLESKIKFIKKLEKKKEGGLRKNKKNFLQIWEVERTKSKVLGCYNLSGFLSIPISKFAFFKLQFEKLGKITESSHPAKEECNELVKYITNLHTLFRRKLVEEERRNRLLSQAS